MSNFICDGKIDNSVYCSLFNAIVQNKIDFVDIRRAYYHAKAIREIYIDLPEGDEEDGMCGMLDKALQGTRDAAQK